MFHYRPALLNNRERMLIALTVAIIFHLGLMSWEFTMPPFFVPRVALPHSVNVFLDRGNKAEKTGKQTPAEETAQEIENKILAPQQQKAKIPPSQDSSAVKNNRDNMAGISPVMEQAKQKIVDVSEQNKKSSTADRRATEREAKYTVEPLMSEKGLKAKEQERIDNKNNQVFSKAVANKPVGTVQTAYPRYRLNPMVPYPGLARKRGQEGTVILQVLVNRDGRVADLEIETSSGFGLLDLAAVSAVRNWSFEPGRKGGEQVVMWVRVPVIFKLK